MFLALVGALNLWLVAVFAAEYRDRRAVAPPAAIAPAPPRRSAEPQRAGAACGRGRCCGGPAPDDAERKPRRPQPSVRSASNSPPPRSPRRRQTRRGDNEPAAALVAAEAAMTADAAYAAAIAALRDRLTERLADGAHAPVVAIVAAERGDGASIGGAVARPLAQRGGPARAAGRLRHRRPTLSAYARRLRKVIVDSPGQVASILRRDGGNRRRGADPAAWRRRARGP